MITLEILLKLKVPNLAKTTPSKIGTRVQKGIQRVIEHKKLEENFQSIYLEKVSLATKDVNFLEGSIECFFIYKNKTKQNTIVQYSTIEKWKREILNSRPVLCKCSFLNDFIPKMVSTVD